MGSESLNLMTLDLVWFSMPDVVQASLPLSMCCCQPTSFWKKRRRIGSGKTVVSSLGYLSYISLLNQFDMQDIY